MAVVEAYPDARIIGLTATPCRMDGRGLGNVFQELVQCPDVAELTRMGFLVPAKVFAPVRPNLKGVRVRAGDYVEGDLAQRVNTNKLVGDIAQHWFRLGERRKTVVFAVNVAHSLHIRDEFRKAGVLAEHLDGTTPREHRKRILKELATGKINLISNVGVLGEGWDCPEASCAILARPTKSLGLFRQMIGRILRPAPGKTDAIVLDHAGGVFAHGLPDDPIHWTLAQDQKASNHVHAARGTAPHTPELVTCPKCSAVRLQGRLCPQCGWRPVPTPRPVDVADGELGRVGSDRRLTPAQYTVKQRRTFHRELMGYRQAHPHYKPGWVYYKFIEKFGAEPPKAWKYDQPLPPSHPTIAWLASRRIAYARSLGR